MSDPPNIRNAFIGGTCFFWTTTFIIAGSHTYFIPPPFPFRHTFFTSLNVGVAGGLFTGIRACLLRLPGQIKDRGLKDMDYVFASGISAGLVGGTFNMINSRGPRMAIPGAIMFGLAGITGQVILNILDRWRVHYIFENESEWNENSRLKSVQKAGNTGTEASGGFGGFGFLKALNETKKTGVDARTMRLREEIAKLNKDIEKVDEEMVLLAGKMESEKAGMGSKGGAS